MTNAEYLRQLRIAAKANGLCYICRCRFPRPGVSTCDDCLERSREGKKTGRGLASARRHSKASSARLRAKRKIEGRCVRCGRRTSVPDYVQCSVCLDAEANRALARRRATGSAPRACSICGEVGHDSRRHARPALLPIDEPKG